MRRDVEGNLVEVQWIDYSFRPSDGFGAWPKTNSLLQAEEMWTKLVVSGSFTVRHSMDPIVSQIDFEKGDPIC